MRCIALVASYKVYGTSYFHKMCKTIGLALLCQPFAWNISYFTIMHGAITSIFCFQYTLWQSYSILT